KIGVTGLPFKSQIGTREEGEELGNDLSAQGDHAPSYLSLVKKKDHSGENCSTGSPDSQVYNGTTEEDIMAPYREEMSEILPLRGSDEWTEPGTGLFRSHTRTLSWAFFFGALAVSALVFFAVLAVVLEMQTTKAGPFADVTETPPTAPPFVPPSEPVVLPDVTSPLSTSTDLQSLLKLTWPIEDIQTRQDKNFVSALNSNKKNDYPVIVPIPLFKQANDNIVTDGMAAGVAALTSRQTLEGQLINSGMNVRAGSPAAAYAIGLRATTPECVRRGTAGFKMTKASQQMALALNLTKEEARQGIVLVNGTDPALMVNEFCLDNVTHVECNRTEIYRSYDGTCNNLDFGRWGSTNQIYRRILLPDYAHGINEPRVGTDETPLPNARDITSYVFQSDPTNDQSASLLLALWGQFVDHDIASSAQSTGLNGTAIACCKDGKLLATQHPECFPLPISYSDSFYASKGQSCMNFVRSAPAPICQFGPREQFNQITSYLDASTLYGSTLDELKDVKGRWGFPTAWNPGRLPTSYIEDGRPLPFRSTDLDDGCNTPEKVEQKQFCFKSGDKRVNEYFGMVSMNLLWIRQHNLVSEELVAGNPDWDEIRIFEETRRVVIAQIQHITYKEFLPLLLGSKMVKAAGLDLLEKGFYNNYDPQVDATISDAFAGAAFRLGHSMIQGLIKKVGPHWKNEDFIQIHKLFYDPFPMYQLGQMDAFLRGQAADPSGKADLHFSKQMTEHMFQLHNSSYGLDLAALDIQRGRDHGLPGYLEWRKVCNLPPVESFNDLTGIWPREAVEYVTVIYKQVEDIDLYVGGLAEKPLDGGMVGPLFSCILADQFLRLRKGDRFWYESNAQLKPFTSSQLQEIRKTTLARIICDNADAILSIQARAMEQVSEKNPRVSCSSDLILKPTWISWKESSSKTVLKSTGNSDPASLEEEFEEDEQEELVQEERRKDRDRSANSTLLKLAPNSSASNDFSNNTNPGSSEQTVAGRNTTSSSSISSAVAQGDVRPNNKLSFRETKQGVIMQWGSVKRNATSSYHQKAEESSDYPDY
ncbi:unnamed protein product, partial [Allacma fusca]